MLGKKRKGEKLFETDLNRVVTPMLDMTFQILFYFLINFRPASPEGQVDLTLPPEDGGADRVAADSFPDEKADEYIITAQSVGGSIEALSFKIKDLPPEYLPPDSMIEALEAKLKAIPKPVGKSKPPVIKIECAKSLRYSALVSLMNTCREMGFKDVGIMPIPPIKKGGAK